MLVAPSAGAVVVPSAGAGAVPSAGAGVVSAGGVVCSVAAALESVADPSAGLEELLQAAKAKAAIAITNNFFIFTI